MKKLILLNLICGGLILSACNRGGTTTTVTVSGNNMTIKVMDYIETPPIEFEKDYDITGMDSAQTKELSKRVLDSIGHGKYK